MKPRSLFLFLVLASLVMLHVVGVSFAVGQDEASQALIAAESSLETGYVAVAQAGAAGANVTDLSAMLQSAGELLVNASRVYDAGDYDTAYSLAVNCSTSLSGIAGLAADSKVSAQDARANALFSAVEFSAVGIGVLAVAGLVVWGFLRKRYLRRLLGMRPEVGVPA